MAKTKTDKDGNIIEVDFGPQKETIENKDGTKIEVSYHLLPNCHDEEIHLGRNYVNYFMKKKYYNKNGKLIKEETELNPHVRKPNAEKLKFLEERAEEDEELRKKGGIYYNPIVM